MPNQRAKNKRAVTLRLTDEELAELDDLVKRLEHSNRHELLRQIISEKLWQIAPPEQSPPKKKGRRAGHKPRE